MKTKLIFEVMALFLAVIICLSILVPLIFEIPLLRVNGDGASTLLFSEGVRERGYPGKIFEAGFKPVINYILPTYYFGMLALISKSIPFLRLTNLIWVIGNFLLIYYLARRVGGRAVAWGTVALTVANLSFLVSGVFVRYYQMTIFFALLTIILLWEFYQDGKRWKLSLALTSAGLNLLTWQASVLIWPGVFIFFLVNRKTSRPHFWAMFKASLLFAGLIVFYLIITHFVRNNYLHYTNEFYVFVRKYGWQYFLQSVHSKKRLLFIFQEINNFIRFFGWPVITIFLLGLWFLRRDKKIAYLSLIIIFFLIPVILFCRQIISRYYLIVSPIFFILMSYELYLLFEYLSGKSKIFRLKQPVYVIAIFCLMFYQLHNYHQRSSAFYLVKGKKYYATFVNDLLTKKLSFSQGGSLLKKQALLFEKLKMEIGKEPLIVILYPTVHYYYLRRPFYQTLDTRKIFIPGSETPRHFIFWDSLYINLEEVLKKKQLSEGRCWIIVNKIKEGKKIFFIENRFRKVIDEKKLQIQVFVRE